MPEAYIGEFKTKSVNQSCQALSVTDSNAVYVHCTYMHGVHAEVAWRPGPSTGMPVL